MTGSIAARRKTGLKSLFRHAVIFSASFLTLLYAGSPPRAADAAPDPAGFDILGMKLGMSVEEIQAAIKAHNPALDIMMTKIPITEVIDAQGTRLGVGTFVQFAAQSDLRTPDFPEFIAVAFTTSQPARAFYIGRKTKFPVGQQPLMDKAVQQLREKYGPESSAAFRDTAFNWIFDKAGKQSAPRASNRFDAACEGGPGSVSYGRRLFVTAALASPQSYWPGCGIELAVSLTPVFKAPEGNTNLLSELDEHLVGDSIAVDDIQKLIAEAKAGMVQQRHRQEEKASGVKAPL
ncbi:MAG TPA: hypothetical protein VHW66_22355 [Stellaceae bacterium]|jgi:hypothetical protein|nr:hypothetical protein [Stellaceae bacterium]